MAEQRKGRGWLSAIDLLPEEADEAVKWAFEELHKRERLQKHIHMEFNLKLVKLGLEPVSLSSFNRHSFRLAKIARRHEEARAITSALAERLDPSQTDDLTIMAAETIKTLVFEMLEDSEGITPKNAMELARALQSAVNSQKLSVDRKRAINEKFEAQVDRAIDKVKGEKGLSDERARELRNDVLGLRK